MAHVIGYTGEIGARNSISPEFAKYKLGDIISRFGIERHDATAALMGQDGQQRVEVDNHGQVRRSEDEMPAIPGNTISP